MKSSVVSLVHLRKSFVDSHSQRETVAVQDFNLEIKPGELITLLGPSGCGKTTVLRMLAGFESPTAGQILLDGKDITSQPPNQRNSAMVFQSYALFPHMSVIENITYGLKLRKIPPSGQKPRMDRILAAVNLTHLANRRPNELSGGQQQRVALARALVVEPALLLFDEPLSNLDAKLRESMRNEIRSLQKKLSITAVYVTHDQSEAMAISDRVVVMNQARIEQIGTPYDVYLRPKTRFVADFMGAANFLPVKALGISDASHAKVQFGDLSFEVPTSGEPIRAGEELLLVIRPEQVRLVKDAAPSSARLTGKIEELHYLGSCHEYVIRLGSDLLMTARQDILESETPVAVGTSVQIALHTEGLHLVHSVS